jgi:hypothetical protein
VQLPNYKSSLEQGRHVILPYMDEAGGVSYAKPDKSKFFIRACVLVKEPQLADLEQQIKQVCSGFKKRDGTHLAYHTHLVFHGKKGWDEVEECERMVCIINMASIVRENNIPVVFACVDKAKMAKRYNRPLNPHLMTFVQIGEIVESWMSNFATDQHWLPCVGATDYNREIEGMYADCRNFGPPFGHWAKKWKRCADIMAFASPARSFIFLLADLCAFFVSRHRQEKEDWGIYDYLQPAIWRRKYFP